MILDDRGEVVWFRPLDTKGVADFRAQRYGGRPVLTWWRGRAERGVGDGYYVIVDETYNEIATVAAGNGLTGDIHEFLITARDTALITIYERKPWDLSSVGGPKDGEIFDGRRPGGRHRHRPRALRVAQRATTSRSTSRS